jgi:hypothetical protein
MIRRIRIWILAGLIGLMFFLIGINPGMFNLDRSEAVGFLQIGLWCTGLSMFLLSLYFVIRIYRNGCQPSLLADVGVRLAATGLVLSVSASYADYLGIGSHTRDMLSFGPLQVIGLTAGILISLIGLALYWPWKKKIRKRRRPAEDENSGSAADFPLSECD